ncbi:hypothetical protein J2S10_004345 [Neobacillus ginsengisoli]|uniref:Uncharacterized protein n=1 Tax=Neobacillus ginsengisoli TaxID=904295 RepID=A0ABT9XZY6_9BACI|nr:hypothetical protein [Neobacillus ginsengisoli]
MIPVHVEAAKNIKNAAVNELNRKTTDPLLPCERDYV